MKTAILHLSIFLWIGLGQGYSLSLEELIDSGNEASWQRLHEEAGEYYLQALQIDNTLAGVLEALAGVRRRQGRHEEAIFYYHQILSLSLAPSDTHYRLQTLLNLASMSLMDDDEILAERYYRQALQLDSSYRPALLALAHLYQNQGRIDEAHDYLATANIAPADGQLESSY